MNTDHTFAILAYKDSQHLKECVESLKKQSVRSEIIICTSTPSIFLENIAKDNRLELLINPEKKGIVSDWNFALEKARTKYVTLAHQDDIYYPQYSQEILRAGGSRDDALIIFSDYVELLTTDEKTTVRTDSLNFFVKKMMLRLAFGNKDFILKNKKRLLNFGNPIGCPAVTYQKDNIGSFKFDNNFSINMDWKAWYDLSKKEGSFIRVKKSLVGHRIYAGSETSQGLAENRRQKEDLEIFKMLWPKSIALLLGKIYSLSYKNNNG